MGKDGFFWTDMAFLRIDGQMPTTRISVSLSELQQSSMNLNINVFYFLIYIFSILFHSVKTYHRP